MPDSSIAPIYQQRVQRNTEYQYIDHLISELDSRKNYSSQLASEFMHLLPSKIIEQPRLHLVPGKFTKYYENDLPSLTELDFCMGEQVERSEDHSLACTLNTAEKVSNHIDQDYFPNIRVSFLHHGSTSRYHL